MNACHRSCYQTCTMGKQGRCKSERSGVILNPKPYKIQSQAERLTESCGAATPKKHPAKSLAPVAKHQVGSNTRPDCLLSYAIELKLSLYLSIYLSIPPSLRPSLTPSIHPSSHPSMCQCIHASMYLYNNIQVYYAVIICILYVCIYIYIYIYTYIYICITVCLIL